MDQVTHLLLSFYVALLIIDLVYAYKKYDHHKFVTFDRPTKRYSDFFVESHKWTVLTTVSAFAWIGLYKVFA